MLRSGVERSTTQPTFAKIGKGAASCNAHKLEGTVDVRSLRCAHKASRHRGRGGGCATLIVLFSLCVAQKNSAPLPGLAKEGCVVQPFAPEQSGTLFQHV